MSTKPTRPQLTPEERELRRARRAAEAAETQARRWRDARQRWDAEGLYLTRAEFEAGGALPGLRAAVARPARRLPAAIADDRRAGRRL
jgi:hypothetical protein